MPTTLSAAGADEAAAVTLTPGGGVTMSSAPSMSVDSVYPGTPTSTGSPAAASAASRVRGPPSHTETRSPYVTESPGARVFDVGLFQCVEAVTLVRTVAPPSPQPGHGLRGAGKRPVALSGPLMYRYGHCTLRSHSSAHARVCTAHSYPPPPNSKIGRQFSSAEPASSGVTIMHCESTSSESAMWTRVISTHPWAPPMWTSCETAEGTDIPNAPTSMASRATFVSSKLSSNAPLAVAR